MSNITHPSWTTAAKKKLIDKKLSQKQLADAVQLNYNYVRQILSGSRQSEPARAAICNFLGITSDTKM